MASPTSSNISATTASVVELVCKPKTCEVGGGGLILPLFGDSEQLWPRWVRRILYLVGLLWFFLGVAIVSDIFMGAIEKITSSRKRVYSKARDCYVTLTVWNATVSNLTLMALGSSAPEILLNVVDLLGKNKMYNGDLGPSTIVGSAAFNLFCITAVCVSAIPHGQVRIIKDTSVFYVTATWSIFAYLWLLAIVAGPWSKDVIDIWEGALTFIFFPVMVFIAWCADRRTARNESAKISQHRMSRSCTSKPAQPEFANAALAQLGDDYSPRLSNSAKAVIERVGTVQEASVQDLAVVEMDILRRLGPEVSVEMLATIVDREFSTGGRMTSRASYRHEATGRLAGGRKSTATRHPSLTNRVSVVPWSDEQDDIAKKHAYLEFIAEDYAVLEKGGKVSIVVVRRGDAIEGVVHVNYRTRDGDAKAGEDYDYTEGELEFRENGAQMVIEVDILHDRRTEPDVHFYVDLHEPSCSSSRVRASLGSRKTTKIRIVDDDLPGELKFEKEILRVKEEPHNTVVSAVVERHSGCSGVVTCKYRTEDATAVASVDYDAASGELRFADGQGAASVELTIKPRGRYDNSDTFRLILSDPTGGAAFTEGTDGGDHSSICTIVIETDQRAKDRVDRLKKMLKANIEKSQVAHQNWKEQFISAFLVNSGADDYDTSSKPVPVESVSASNGKGNTVAQTARDVEEAGYVCSRGTSDSEDCVATLFGETPSCCGACGGACGGGCDSFCGTSCGNNFNQGATHQTAAVAWPAAGSEKPTEKSASQTSRTSTQRPEESSQCATLADYAMHAITVFWKVLFAFIPPVDYCGGWACFWAALLMIGLVTAFIGDMASLLGCVWGIPDAITAVTLVALGTSMPDTFASKTAAEQDPYADASVGNVTGSNSVNVFLGIGLPWMIAATYWKFEGGTDNPSRYQEWYNKYHRPDTRVTIDYPKGDVFVVLGGALSYSVILFTVTALVALLVLQARRRFVGGELGGPARLRWATSSLLIMLWIAFIILYCMKVLETQGECD